MSGADTLTGANAANSAGSRLSAAQVAQQLAVLREQERQAAERARNLEQALAQLNYEEWQARQQQRQTEAAQLAAELSAVAGELASAEQALASGEAALTALTTRLEQEEQRLRVAFLAIITNNFTTTANSPASVAA